MPHSSDSFYLQNAILRNAYFFTGPHAKVDIVEELQPSGTWHVHVVKIEAGKRSSALSESAPDAEEALKKLHVKSAQAVHEHIRTNEFNYPPVISSGRSRSSSSRGGVADRAAASEVIALCSSSSENEAASDSDESFDRRTTNRRGRGQRRNRRVAVSPRSLHSDDFDQDDDEDDDAHMSEASRDRSPYRMQRVPVGPPRPPQAPPQPREYAPWAPVAAPSTVRPPPPPARPIVPPPRSMNTMMPQPQGPLVPLRCFPAMLNIKWMGRGCKNLLAKVAPTESALTHLAVTEARMRPGGFTTTSADERVPYSSFSPVSLRAVIRRVTLGGDMYEVSGFGDDLSALFRGSSDMPKFDIEVIDVLMPALVRPRADSMSSANSDIADAE